MFITKIIKILIFLLISFNIYNAHEGPLYNSDDMVSHGHRIKGTYKIIDGDTVKIGKKLFRLLGFDAPEMWQLCKDSRGQTVKCGVIAKEYLVNLYNKNKNNFSCVIKDRIYRRYLAVCYIGNLSVGSIMVKSGHAMVYRDLKHYVEEQNYAQEHKLGLWNYQVFVTPYVCRARHKKHKNDFCDYNK